MMNALKEWATIVNALENGDQTVLLRKGGILEDSSGFVVESEKFFLFPTFEHQEKKHLKPQFYKHLEDALAGKPKDGNCCQINPCNIKRLLRCQASCNRTELPRPNLW
jgi:hypothetical protein